MLDSRKNITVGNKQIAHHIFAGSIAMMGVCVTVIALFSVLQVSLKTYADELLAVNNFIFITAALLSYTSMRKDAYSRLEYIADRLFFAGMIIMVIVGVMIVMIAY